MRSDVAEARDLRRLCRQVRDRVVDQVRDGERPVYRRRCEVADRHADVFTTWLGAQPCEHRVRQLDPVHRHSSLREGDGDPARSDPELERASVSGEVDEEVDNRIDDRRVEHLGRGFVVSRGDALVEVAVVLSHRRNLRVPYSLPQMSRCSLNQSFTARNDGGRGGRFVE